MLLTEYYEQWIDTYKRDAIRPVTLQKYINALQWLKNHAADVQVGDLNRQEYQRLLNLYATEHEKQTTTDFHHHLKAATLDMVDDGLLDKGPTRRIVIKGKKPRPKKQKFLNQFELQKLIADLDLGPEITYDWLIMLTAKTGVRFAEGLGITPEDFDFSKQTLSINKTWDYKEGGGFQPTKNKSSNRKIQIDWQLSSQFAELTKDLPKDKPIFVKDDKKVYSTTVNDILERHCKSAKVPVLSMHGLRHTHASLLLLGGVSIASVSQRLGHSNMATTQKVYLHVVKEMENKDTDLVMRQMSMLG